MSRYGVSAGGYARMVDGKAVTTDEAGDAACCCNPNECYFRYMPCAPGSCPPDEVDAYFPCSACQDVPCDTTILADGICYQKTDDTRYTECPDGGEPPDGFQCLPVGAKTPAIDGFLPDCDEFECVTEYFEALPCDGTPEGQPCVVVPCNQVPDDPEACLIFTVGTPGDCICYTVSRKHKKKGPDGCNIVNLENEIFYETCCECFEQNCANDCDHSDPGDCYAPNPGSVFGRLAALGYVIPEGLECCCDETDLKQYEFGHTEQWNLFTCGDCPDQPYVTGKRIADSTVVDGEGSCTRRDELWTVDCAACENILIDPGEVFEFTVAPAPTQCCPSQQRMCPELDVLIPFGNPDEYEIVSISVQFDGCDAFTVNWEWYEVNPFTGNKIGYNRGFWTRMTLKDAGDCGGPDCKSFQIGAPLIPGEGSVFPSLRSLLRKAG